MSAYVSYWRPGVEYAEVVISSFYSTHFLACSLKHWYPMLFHASFDSVTCVASSNVAFL